jgi:diguanylate cyclase (GGDEF)-like protein
MTGSQRVWILTVVLTAVSVLLAIPELPEGAVRSLPLPIPWPLVALAFYVVETRVVHLHIGRSAHSLSMAEIPLLFGLFFLDPGSFIAARMLGGGLALAIARRQRSVKLAFNLSQFLFSSVVAVTVVHVLVGPGTGFGPREWAAAYLATSADCIVGIVAIATAISLAEGRAEFHRIPEMLRTGLMISLANTSLALLAIIVITYQPIALILFVVPIGVAFIAYRSYVAQRQQKDGLEMLYESTRILQRSPQVDLAVVELLRHARTMFRADVAELTLLPARDGDELLRTTSRGQGEESMVPVGRAVDDPILARALEERQAVLITAADPEAAPRFRNAMVAPLIGESRVMGTLVVANRLSDISTFDLSDLRLFETLANHIAVSLENGQLEQSLSRLVELKEELHHQANHDSLTGLANRALFTQAVSTRLATTDQGGRMLVVLFLDLDDFKLVNDTMGHPVGDALLRAVGQRITASLRPNDVAARLGGDEFAVVLWDREDLVGARRAADRLLAAIDEPFVLDSSVLSIHASIGIAAGSSSGASSDDLMRNADVAMYVAKANGKGRVVVFESDMARALTNRTEMTAALRRAVVDGQLVLHYQPVFDLQTGQVVGTEALVRWNHPDRGLVEPLEFIPMAEQSSLILDLGFWVLRASLRQMAEWDRLGEPYRSWWMSVNVSPRQLEHPGFVDDVRMLLEEYGTTPSRLALEVTESGLIPNPEEASDKLQALRHLGIRLMIDDFGTGYSSLGYLQRFPVGALKIAREFVDVDADQPGAWGLAAAILAMARTLDLDVIAEGVEEEAQLERLRELGCEYAQGFLLARPMPAGQLEARYRPDAPRLVAATTADDPDAIAPPATPPERAMHRRTTRDHRPAGIPPVRS